MDGSERDHITPDPAPPEPPYLQWARNVRQAWNELYPIALSVVLIGVVVLLAVRPDLRDPPFLSMVGTALIALGGYSLRRRRS